jgi:hypothetical protein
VTKKKPAVRKPRKKWKVTIWRYDENNHRIFPVNTRLLDDVEWEAYAAAARDTGNTVAGNLLDHYDRLGAYIGTRPTKDFLIRERIT